MAADLYVVAGQNVCRRVLHELEGHTSAISLLQRVDELAVTIFEVLVDDFNLALELNPWGSAFPLSCRSRVNAVCVRIVGENKCACEQNHAGANGAAEDPRGTDLCFHGGTFLLAMIAICDEQNEIT